MNKPYCKVDSIEKFNEGDVVIINKRVKLFLYTK